MNTNNKLFYRPYTPNIKSLTVAKYIFDEVDKVDKDPSIRKINLLTYIAHGHMYALHNKPLLDEEMVAWMVGPAIPSLFQTRDHPPPNLSEVKVDFSILTEDEKDVLYLVTTRYAQTPTSDLTTGARKHRTPWKISWDFNTNRKNTNAHIVIDQQLIKHFYKQRGYTSTELYF